MKNRLSVILFAFVMFTLTISGCTSNTTKFPTGEFIDEEGHINNFMSDGRFTLRFTDGRVLIKNGQYSVDGDIVTIIETEICPPVDGVYKWAYQDGKLLFELIEDDCTDRPLTISRNGALTPYP